MAAVHRIGFGGRVGWAAEARCSQVAGSLARRMGGNQMNDIQITLTGNVAAEPRQYTFEDGAKVTSLRVLTTHRYYDKRTGQWADGEKVCFAVRCWRSLGDNVAHSVRIGQPIVVSGKLRIREFGPEGDRRFMPEVEASAVGHDLRWGTGVFTKPERAGAAAAVSREMRDRLDEETQDWAMGARRLPARRPETAPNGPAGSTAHAGSETPGRPQAENAPGQARAEGTFDRPGGVETRNDLSLEASGTSRRRSPDTASADGGSAAAATSSKPGRPADETTPPHPFAADDADGDDNQEAAPGETTGVQAARGQARGGRATGAQVTAGRSVGGSRTARAGERAAAEADWHVQERAAA
ncbi:single-stranded DNA-binding protein [Nonomuraea sp. NPDC005983]|uniref:single-stranded DNA-binding protein n=1 Tax=Nonomuraea sp. NPDC005983 TaxID=3155595 RepID=UPI0033AFB6CF